MKANRNEPKIGIYANGVVLRAINRRIELIDVEDGSGATVINLIKHHDKKIEEECLIHPLIYRGVVTSTALKLDDETLLQLYRALEDQLIRRGLGRKIKVIELD